MSIDNILSVSITVLGIELTVSICWLSICVGIESEYGDGFYKELGVGTRYAMVPKDKP